MRERVTAPDAAAPAVSVVLPVFNRLEYLRPAVESVFAQTFTDWELIVADDGSGHETRSYLQTLHDPPRVRVIWLSHTGRPSVVRNVALREARGDYVAFLDSDDRWLPRKLEAQIASLTRGANRRWSHTRFILIDEAGNPTPHQHAPGRPVPQGWIVERLVTGETVIAAPSVVVSRALLEELGGFDEELVMCEDYDLWLRLAQRSEIDAIDDPLTLVTRHGEHHTNAIGSFQDDLRVIEKMLSVQSTAHVHATLRRQRAEVAVALARSHAACGERITALRTLRASAGHSWRYAKWWFGALQTVARTATPAAVRNVVRRYRAGRGVPAQPQA